MLDFEGKWPKQAEQTGSTFGLSEIQTAIIPPLHDTLNK